MGRKNDYDFYTRLEVRASDKAGVEYIDVLGNIPYDEIEAALRNVFLSSRDSRKRKIFS